MGRGDKKSKKGKIRKDSYGNSRNKKQLKAKLRRTSSKKATLAPVEEAAPKPKRTAAKRKSDV